MRTKLSAILATIILSLATAAAAAAWTQSQAAQTMYVTTKWKAACGQGYWTCSTYSPLSLQKLNGLDPQWRGSSNIFRFGGGVRQTCLVVAEINSNGSLYGSPGVNCYDLNRN
jgi:hypothetical protein